MDKQKLERMNKLGMLTGIKDKVKLPYGQN